MHVDNITASYENKYNSVTDVDDSDTLATVHVAMVIVGVLSVAGTIGNALVIYVFALQKPKLTSTIFILTLACTDFVTSLVTMPYTIVIVLLKYKVQYDVICKIYQFLVTSTVPFSAFVMVAIAFDRYLCIVHPFKHMTSMTLKRAKAIVALLFFLAFTIGLLCCLMFGTHSREVICVKTNNFTLDISDTNKTSRYRKVADHVHCNATLQGVVHTGYCVANNIIFDLAFHAAYQKIYSAFFDVCAMVVIVLYVIIYRTVLTRRRQHIKTAVMLSIVAVTYIVAFMPAWLMALRVITYNAVIFYLYFTYNVANPIIYAFLNESFRNHLQALLSCRSQSATGLRAEEARRLQTTTPQPRLNVTQY